MAIRIQVSHPTVTAMQRRWQEADTAPAGGCTCRPDDVRLVRRIKVRVEHWVNPVPVAVLSEQWGFTPARFYQWLTEFVLEGLGSLRYPSGGGCQAKLTPTHKKHLGVLIEPGRKRRASARRTGAGA